MNNTPIETEVKLLIKMPDIDEIKKQPQLAVKEIIQTYLCASEGVTRRVRQITIGEKVKYILTEKIRISKLSAYEAEKEISEKEYAMLLTEADSDRTPIKKIRYVFPYDSHLMELDVYPFWSDRAILEVELSNEDEKFSLPPIFEIIKDVSGDKRYKNAMLAKTIVYDEI